ncbi:MerR family transcriptional regulator [Streptomyces sp. NPDC004111]|uniref:MerR family transcriptional regulator n=1 Tax=Streptomyces sp. NPDC004111 TaxID=3364690 RepID=UPI0036827346
MNGNPESFRGTGTTEEHGTDGGPGRGAEHAADREAEQAEDHERVHAADHGRPKGAPDRTADGRDEQDDRPDTTPRTAPGGIAGPVGPVGLSTGAVARRLGVAPTTLRSWDRRYGIGPAVRGDGRHRRWTAADVALLERMCALTARGIPPAEAARLARTSAAPGPEERTEPPARTDEPEQADHRGRLGRQEKPDDPARSGRPEPDRPDAGEHIVRPKPTDRQLWSPTGALAELSIPAPRLPDVGVPARTVRGLRNAAVRLDSPTLDELLNDTVRTHGLVDCWQEAMSPALRAIGRTWANSGDAAGERYVEAEHLLSWHVSTALRRNTPAKEVDDDQPVLLACLPGELHTLALEALDAALAERGLPTRMFGAAVPLGALSEAVRRTGPRAVVLWSQTRPTADRSVVGRVRATARGIRGARTQPVVLAAGPGWDRTGPSEGVHRPRDLASALRIIEDAPHL